MSEVVIETVEADANTLRSAISFTPDLRRFFSGEDLFVEYSVDVSDVPERVLTIPVLAQVCPVAWLQGADVYVRTVDAAFYDSLRTVRDALLEMYPELLEGGDVYYEHLVEGDESGASDATGLLFTGGVDSTFSFARLRDRNPRLVNVNGWALRNDQREKWREMKRYLGAFGERHGVEDLYVNSNMLSFLRNVMLIAYSDPYVEGAWYSSVGHGLGLPGLCAPLAYATGITDLYMAATHWRGASFPWGSRPSIVDNVAWGATDTHHDGYEYTRQERVEEIARFVDAEDPDLTLLTCSNEVTENCGRCEKCCRTAVAMLGAGLDPNRHGLALSPETFDYIRTELENGNWKLSENEKLFWEDLRDTVASDVECPIEGSEDFFEWLRTADFDAFAQRHRKPIANRYVYPVYRTIPYPLFNALDSHLEIGPFGSY